MRRRIDGRQSSAPGRGQQNLTAGRGKFAVVRAPWSIEALADQMSEVTCDLSCEGVTPVRRDLATDGMGASPVIDASSKSLLENAITRLGLSARAYDRILKVSRTLADLQGKESIEPEHVSEAIQYRTLDRNFWA
jgi:hypothetical protein